MMRVEAFASGVQPDLPNQNYVELFGGWRRGPPSRRPSGGQAAHGQWLKVQDNVQATRPALL